MASLTQWMWVWVTSGSWWWTGRPGVLQFMGSQRVRHDWATDLIWSGYNQLVCLNSLVTYLGNTVFFLKINKMRLWRVNGDVYVTSDLGESQEQVWEVLTSRPNLLLKANWPRRWGNNVPKSHLAQVSIQAFFLVYTKMGRECDW